MRFHCVEEAGEREDLTGGLSNVYGRKKLRPIA